jgi:hypothetical protein
MGGLRRTGEVVSCRERSEGETHTNADASLVAMGRTARSAIEMRQLGLV